MDTGGFDNAEAELLGVVELVEAITKCYEKYKIYIEGHAKLIDE